MYIPELGIPGNIFSTQQILPNTFLYRDKALPSNPIQFLFHHEHAHIFHPDQENSIGRKIFSTVLLKWTLFLCNFCKKVQM